MKILYYSPHPQLRIDAPTGYGTHIREMIAAWRRMDIEVKTLIAGDSDGKESSAGSGSGEARYSSFKRLIPKLIWETVRDESLRRFDRQMERRLMNLIQDFKPDFIYERVAYLQSSGINAARKMGVKHIAEINAPYPEERVSFSGKSLFLAKARKIEKQFLAQSTGICVVSSALKAHFEKLLPSTGERIHVIPNAVNPDEIESNQETIDLLRDEYKIEDEIIVGFVGSMFPYHGVDILIAAFAKLADEPKVRLLIIGDGAILSDLKAQAKRLGVFEKTIFTGSLPHRKVYAHIELMDIATMPKSNWYGSPVKIFEYGLFGKPVIAPDTQPVRDVMTAEDGILVKPEVQDFFEALLNLVENTEMRKELGSNWNAKVLKKYTWDAAARDTLKLCT